MTAFGHQHPDIVADIFLNTLANRIITGSRSLIISNQRFPVIGIGADNADGIDFCFVQWQKMIVIFQKDDAFFSRLQIQRLHFGGIDDRIRNVIIGSLCLFVEHPQFHSCRKKMNQRFVHSFLRYHPFLHSIPDINEKIAAVQVTAVCNRKRHRLLGSRRYAMTVMKIPDGPAVGNNMPLKAPFISQNIL